MSLLDVQDRQPTVADEILQYRMSLRALIDRSQRVCTRLHGLVEKYGQEQVEEALGGDVTDLNILYDKLQALLLSQGREVQSLVFFDKLEAVRQ